MPGCYRVVKWRPSSSILSRCLVKKLLVGHTRSISGLILRWRDLRLTTSSILYEMICCLWRVRLLCTSPCGIPTLPQRPFMRGPHDASTLPIAPNEVVNKQWYCAYYILKYTQTHMAAIWQWDNKNSNQRLTKKNDQNNCCWTFAVHFFIECEFNSPKVTSGCRNVNQIKIYLTHPTKIKNRWNEKYSIFFAGSVYEVRDLFPWEMVTKMLISCVLNVEKIWNSAQINLSSTLNFFTENIVSTQQYPPRNRPLKSTMIWRKMTCNCT